MREPTPGPSAGPPVPRGMQQSTAGPARRRQSSVNFVKICCSTRAPDHVALRVEAQTSFKCGAPRFKTCATKISGTQSGRSRSQLDASRTRMSELGGTDRSTVARPEFQAAKATQLRLNSKLLARKTARSHPKSGIPVFQAPGRVM